jgi:hypothetical protein
MTVTLTDGIKSVALTGAFIQELSFEEGAENSKTMGMVNGRAEYVHQYIYGTVNKGAVKGRGALTMSPGLGQPHGITAFSGGVLGVTSVKYTEKINDTADWEYVFEHLPHAS